MSIFDDREKSFEQKFGHDQELAFKAKVRRNKLLGLWAAGQLGLQGAAAEAYAADLVQGELQHRGDAELISRIARDFADRGIGHDEHRVRVELSRFDAIARKQLDIPD